MHPTGIRGKLKITLASTNPIESMIGTVRHANRNVKHWQNGDMCLWPDPLGSVRFTFADATGTCLPERARTSRSPGSLHLAR
jgi:hypothetical protein